MEINNINKCFSKEEIIQFAQNPVLSQNEDIATHLSTCTKCGNFMKLVVDVMSSTTNATTQDVKVVRDFLSQIDKKKNPLWLKFYNILKDTCTPPTIQLPKINALPSFSSTPTLSASPKKFNKIPTTPNTLNINQSIAKNTIKMVFAASCDNDNIDYWKAEVLMATSLLPGNNIKITVLDKNGKLISKGELLLFGNKLLVQNGQTSLNMDMFRRGLNNSEVKFTFESGRISDGDLIFI